MDKIQIDDLAKILPAIPGINGSSEYIKSSVLILTAHIDGEIKFLLQKRARNVRQGGEISFPGGMFDPSKDKNMEETAQRETMEEMGLLRSQIKVIGRADTVISSGMMIEGFVGFAQIDKIEDIKENPEEVEKVLAVPVSFFILNKPEVYRVCIKAHPSIYDKKGRQKVLLPAAELSLPDRYRKPWGGFLQKIYFYRYENEIIWGITARFIFDIIKRLTAVQ